WRRLSNAALSEDRGTFKINHPFSPLCGKEYRLIERRTCWGEDRLLCFDENGASCLVLTSWTDYLPPDPFVAASDGRADFRLSDLVELNMFLNSLDDEVSR
ncbi:MAG: Y4bD/Y4pK family protein, partial [Acetatifactor sp.]|nr:Y4bD/Y4pK family protein [Acetatifactor sp.]